MKGGFWVRLILRTCKLNVQLRYMYFLVRCSFDEVTLSNFVFCFQSHSFL